MQTNLSKKVQQNKEIQFQKCSKRKQEERFQTKKNLQEKLKIALKQEWLQEEFNH